MSARIHELAKLYDVDPRDMLNRLKTLGFVGSDVKSVSSTVSKIYYDEIERVFGGVHRSARQAASDGVTLVGEFTTNMLGAFSTIRGFATLQDLAATSTACYFKSEVDGSVSGHQRKEDEDHAEEIKTYFEKGDHTFIPEIILSLRIGARAEIINERQVGIAYEHPQGLVSVRRVRHGQNDEQTRTHKLVIARNDKRLTEPHPVVRRIDGNHRLAKAAELAVDPGRPNRYLVPFCIIVLGPPGEAADDYAESLIFHTINSTARPLDSEHALELILNQDPKLTMPAAREFAFNPALHLTRLLNDHIRKLPPGTKAILGERSLSRLATAAREMLRSYPEKKANLAELRTFAGELVGTIVEITVHMDEEFHDFVNSECFHELVAHAWMQTSGTDRPKRMRATLRKVTLIAQWLGNDGLRGLRSDLPLGRQLIQIHDTILSRTPKRVFLARWYPQAKDGDALKLAKVRLAQVQATLDNVERETGQALKLRDLGSENEPVKLIHDEMWDAIRSADIIVADLSGLRPNVFAEAGFALQHMNRGRLIFLFQPFGEHTKVPFDLSPYNRVEVSDAGEIPEKLSAVLKEILEKAARGEI